jgi:CBS domain-containing protein
MELLKIGRSQVVSVKPEATLEETARVMREHHVGDVVVAEERGNQRFPVGIMTDRDIVMATLALGAPTAPMLAEDLMTTDLVTVGEQESLVRVIELMKENGVKRVPILGKEKELVGIIALEDIMRLLSQEIAALTEVGRRQKEIEFDRRRKLA